MGIHPRYCLLLLLVGLPARAQVSITTDHGNLRVKGSSGATLSDLHLQLHLADHAVSGGMELASHEHASDAAGEYDLYRYGMGADASEHLQATLEVRRYLTPEVLVATLVYDGPPLAATDGVDLGMELNDFARGMALHRLKLWWLTPTFISDPRLLAGANQLLIWQQMHRNEYHLLVPLAGDGMVGELGVSDFDQFRVALSSYDAKFTPHRIPLFAYASGDNPYQLAPAVYTAAFAANSYYGKLRWEKPFPEVFRSLGWCSWNTYQDTVSEDKVLKSVQSLRQHEIPIGFVLVDEGWRTAHGQKLAGYDADRSKFPHGLAGLAQTLHGDYHVPHVGVWHVFQGYWEGVDPDSDIGRNHSLFAGDAGQYLPDPRNSAGEGFYADWYKFLKNAGVDFVKVDNQASNPRFTNGLLPLFTSGEGEQRNVQDAALQYLPSKADPSDARKCVSVLNCMDMSLENAFNWRYSNVARDSEDYNPDSLADIKDHIFWSAYNAYWTANFAYPDWDMFETRRDDGEYQAIARAISGGPIYTTDAPGQEHPEHLLPLALSNGTLLMLDAPGMVTTDVLLRDTSLEPVPLKVIGTITRPGLKAGMEAVFNANKSAQTVSGVVGAQDIDGVNLNLMRPGQPGSDGLVTESGSVAVYRRSTGKVTVLDSQHPEIAVKLGEFGKDLFTFVPVDQDVAVFGALDKYLGPAAVESVKREGTRILVRLLEPADFGAYVQKPLRELKVDGKTLSASAYTYSGSLLRIPNEAFSPGRSDHEVELALSE